jgi:uncharacterized protein YlxW (UPF0749 family)
MHKINAKVGAKISIAIVCAILGFMLAYQAKMLINQDKTLNITNQNSSDVTVQIEQYKKEETDLENKVTDLQKQVKSYEDAAAGKSDATKSILNQLDNLRLLTGAVDVAGQGVTIYLTPDSTLFGNNIVNNITDKHLVYLVNELRFAGAEAISINDIRITSRTGIRNAGNNILIGDSQISPTSRITINAIGDKNLLYSALDFPEVFADFKGVCTVKYEKEDSITIKKYTQTLKFDFAKPVNQ